METLSVLLQKKATDAIAKVFSQQLESTQTAADVAHCNEESFGHYQCNSALKLSKILKKNPREIAQAIVDAFDRQTQDQKPMISKVDIAGPGFINITLDPTYLSHRLQRVLSDPHLGAMRSQKRQKIIVEFSSPNIAKELHVGHLRSTIIGECIARLFEFLGQEVLRLNHIGDWGTQFGMLIAYMKEHVPDVLKGEQRTDLTHLMHWYKASKKQFDEDSEFKKRAQKKVVDLQSGDEEALHAWNIICDISRAAFEEIYELLNVELIERGESFYNTQLPTIVIELEKKGIVTISDGAKCIFLEGFKNREGNSLPLMIQKSDGGYNYDTTDMAAMHHRIFEEKADRIIVVTDAGQSLHFQLIYHAAEKAGWFKGRKIEFDHVTFGLVLGPDGKKFKTREGETEKLIDLLNQAIEHAKAILSERLPVIGKEELDQLAHTLGIGAVKYADLSCHRQKDYQFSYDRMLKFEGNTAAFLLYSFVRIMGIKRKTGADMQEILDNYKIDLEHPSEIALGFHLLRFGEILEMVSRDLLPNRLTDYLYELAEKFNAFFRDCRVQGSEKEGNRLVLCEVTARILKQGLHILGLQTMNRM